MISHVVGLIIEESKVLLIHRPDKDIWELPGGKVHPGEEIEDALRREVMEELGVNINILQHFNEYQLMENEETYHGSVFECSIKSGNLGVDRKFSFVELDKVNEYELNQQAKVVISDLK